MFFINNCFVYRLSNAEMIDNLLNFLLNFFSEQVLVDHTQIKKDLWDTMKCAHCYRIPATIGSLNGMMKVQKWLPDT